ncbi:MAG TPA: hypothetical protein VEK76_00440 [Candidatus Binatia bacterium]|nr:hypothetical protein [Candidatus Binatia bacterium]
MRFLETLFRHRIIAILPIVIGLVVAAGYELVQPRTFTSTADLWVDASTPGQSGTTSNQYVDPSTTQESVIQELVDTRSFDIAVGQVGGLSAFLAAHPGAEVTGIAAVPGLGELFKSAPGSVDDQVATMIPAELTITATGPQVITISATGPTPAVTEGIINAVVSQYELNVVQAATTTDQTAVSYYTQQLAQAQTTLNQAESAYTDYVQANPTVIKNGGTSAQLIELQQSVANAQSNYQSVNNQLQQAQLNLANVGNQTGVRVLDAPQAGTSVSIKKKLLTTGIAGLVVGLIISLLLITVLTATDRTARRAEDVKRALGVDVVGSIDRVAGGTSGPQSQASGA